MKIGIIGKGNVGTALANGLGRAGHQIKFGHRNPQEPVKNAIEWGEVIILVIPHESVKETVTNFGSAMNGKTLIDVTNVFGDNLELPQGYTISEAEEI
jgi:hypothetical protein